MSGAPMLTSQREIISAAMQLGAETVAGWSQAEAALARNVANGGDGMAADMGAPWADTPLAAGGDGTRALSHTCGADTRALSPDTRGADSRGAAAGKSREPPTFARDTSPHTARDRCATNAPAPLRDRAIEDLRAQISAGDDPLGSAFINLRTSADRRTLGATYTPFPIVHAMLAWAAREQHHPERIIDPGVGSGRFLLHAARLFPRARLIGVEVDPLAALIARANLAAAGVADRAVVKLNDYRELDLRSQEHTLFVGNPPYVRHHLIESHWKEWLAAGWSALGIRASRLAGLHIHFFLATLLNARSGDYGAFVTSAEWLDVNYGSSLRNGFLGNLGGEELIVLEPTAAAFPGAATTAAVALFKVGSHPASIRVRRVMHLTQMDSPGHGQLISRDRLVSETHWSRLTSPPRPRRAGLVELGELCRVHRGQATGANSVWVVDETTQRLPRSVLFPTVTRARELIAAGAVLPNIEHLRQVVDLPENLDELDYESRLAVETFLREAIRRGAHVTYIARHRPKWWSVGLRPAAPILATYMARHAPVFTLNPAGARHLNIAHGLYPREYLTERQLRALVEYLSNGVSIVDGRTYAGGLTKFEPREMERIRVPWPGSLGAEGSAPLRCAPCSLGRPDGRRAALESEMPRTLFEAPCGRVMGD
jgi:adenine-specific DNA-methyltransferase